MHDDFIHARLIGYGKLDHCPVQSVPQHPRRQGVIDNHPLRTAIVQIIHKPAAVHPTVSKDIASLKKVPERVFAEVSQRGIGFRCAVCLVVCPLYVSSQSIRHHNSVDRDIRRQVVCNREAKVVDNFLGYAEVEGLVAVVVVDVPETQWVEACLGRESWEWRAGRLGVVRVVAGSR